MKQLKILKHLISRGLHSSSKVPWPSCPELLDPKEYTDPDEVTAMLWLGPAIAWDFSLRQHISPANIYLRTNFQDPPQRCLRSSFSSEFIGLKMALSWHMSNAASSVIDNWTSGAKFEGFLKNVHVASRLARSRGSKSQLVRIMRTIEGVSAKGNSPGFESPKQCLCTRLKVRCNGGTKERDGSTMVWNGREELLPLVVGSIGQVPKDQAVEWIQSKAISSFN